MERSETASRSAQDVAATRRHHIDAVAAASAPVDPGTCKARIGEGMPSWAPRKGSPCGMTAQAYDDLMVGGTLVELPLCGVHYRKLCNSADARALLRSWLPS
jgi:hypothetical protein